MRTAAGTGAGLAEMDGELIGAVRRRWRPFQLAVWGWTRLFVNFCGLDLAFCNLSFPGPSLQRGPRRHLNTENFKKHGHFFQSVFLVGAGVWDGG